MKTLARSSRISLRAICAADGPALVALNRASRSLHQPWVAAPQTRASVRRYFTQVAASDHLGLGIYRRDDDALVGVINLSHIVRGAFQSAYLGYYIGAPYAGQGFMREGLTLAIRHAFGRLRLHRLEANIQPANARSIHLMQSLGFRCEGLARRYLKLGGRWRDHEHWVLLAEDWRRPSGGRHRGG